MTAASEPCPICKAKADQPCLNTITPGQPLPGRTEHYGRTCPSRVNQ